eukprot:7309-Heterococcus_DN1.PRE.2
MQRRRLYSSDSSSYKSSASERLRAPAHPKHDPQLFDAMLQLRECRLENERLAKQLAREQSLQREHAHNAAAQMSTAKDLLLSLRRHLQVGCHAVPSYTAYRLLEQLVVALNGATAELEPDLQHGSSTREAARSSTATKPSAK